ncbi:MAG: 30S ribosomal protein S12 methylthiotransferase RimO [Verrucomicrobia bacterium]|nr:MAG: 30S ribosomal protein S12 methylthiotransferase RimO [Verrucomicrobiota bacterium]PYJ34066.1 MAG: 30S ribosomal protein S12 methylthiotransferase RimO [Verrucomicrobiota bacterium]
MISLGCAKNLVDAEIMLGSVLQHGMEITSRPEDADVLVINTCAFIDSAKEESIGAILEAHQQRGLSRRPHQKLIVSGCMSQRFAKELRQEMPEVDGFVRLDQVSELGMIIENLLAKRPTLNAQRPTLNGENDDVDLAFADTRPTYIPDYNTPRFRLTPEHFAYVKIAEGCNHPCSFCVIPQMRGKHRSRFPKSVLAEISALVREGVREINLISQDTTYYGMDLWPSKAGPRQPIDSARGPTLSALLREIQQIEGEFWVRLLYTHPAHWSDELIEAIAQCDKVARYIDIPLQHIDDSVLQRMRRETSRAHIENLIHKLRAEIPGLALRTTFIVGFPGETGAEFENLLDFIRRVRFERLGIFKYSQEMGSRAAKMPGQIPAKIKNARYRAAMLAQQQIAHEIACEKIGRELKLLVDQPHIARTEGDASDVDARVVLSKAAPVGEFIWRRITGSRGYDLLA